MGLYSFKRIGHLKWIEAGAWDLSQYMDTAEIMQLVRNKYPNAVVNAVYAYMKWNDTGAYYVESKVKSEHLTITIEFQNESDEAEFILKESK